MGTVPGLHDGGDGDVGAAGSCSSSHSPHPPSSCTATATLLAVWCCHPAPIRWWQWIASKRGWVCWVAKYQCWYKKREKKNLSVAWEISVSWAFSCLVHFVEMVPIHSILQTIVSMVNKERKVYLWRIGSKPIWTAMVMVVTSLSFLVLYVV